MCAFSDPQHGLQRRQRGGGGWGPGGGGGGAPWGGGGGDAGGPPGGAGGDSSSPVSAITTTSSSVPVVQVGQTTGGTGTIAVTTTVKPTRSTETAFIAATTTTSPVKSPLSNYQTANAPQSVSRPMQADPSTSTSTSPSPSDSSFQAETDTTTTISDTDGQKSTHETATRQSDTIDSIIEDSTSETSSSTLTTGGKSYRPSNVVQSASPTSQADREKVSKPSRVSEAASSTRASDKTWSVTMVDYSLGGATSQWDQIPHASIIGVVVLSCGYFNLVV